MPAGSAMMSRRPVPTPPEQDSPHAAPRLEASRVAYLLPVIGAPIGIGVAVFASFAIAGWRVTHSAVVQVEPQWVAGEPLAARVQVQDGAEQAVDGAEVEVALRRGEQRVVLGTLRDAAGVGAAQGRLQAPAWPPGPATLELEIVGHERFGERVDVEIVAARAARRGTHTVSGSIKNYADDSEAQAERLKLVLRPLGRLVAGFENALIARVTDPEGKPHRGKVEIRLLDGEFGPHKATREQPALIAAGETDAAGLLRVDGLLASDVVRFEVRALAPAEVAQGAGPEGQGAKDSPARGAGAPTAAGEAGAKDSPAKGGGAGAKDSSSAKGDAMGGAAAAGKGGAAAGDAGANGGSAGDAVKQEGGEPAALAARKFRMVSFAGAVAVEVAPSVAGAGDAVTIKARGLRPKRAVFVDLHAPDGAWIDTLDPPIVGPEPPRAWSTAGLAAGLVQVEGYHFANAPGESAGIARLVLGAGPGQAPAIGALIALQRDRLELPRVEKDWSRELEGKYLDALAAANLEGEALALARAWLVGTLPVEVLGPPTVLATRAREDAELAAARRLWAGRVRWLLLGGGGVFLLVTTLLIVLSHRAAAGRLAREMFGQGPEVLGEIRRAQRVVLLRAVGLVVTMGLGLVLTAAVLDKLFWQT